MSFGLQQAGVDVIAGLDIDITCRDTYEANLKQAKFIHADITRLSEKSLTDYVEISINDDSMIFVGCSPCQFWTKLNTNKDNSSKSKNLLFDFLRFISHYKPGYVVVENVPGIWTRRSESGIELFIKALKNMDFKVEHKIVNLNKFGVPQIRKRFTLIASRVIKKGIFPKEDIGHPPVVRDFIGLRNGFPKISCGHKDYTNFMHTASGLSEKNLKRICSTKKDGGTRSDWANTDLQLETYKNRDSNSFVDTYGRIYWDKPAPTITTKFHSLSNGRFGHPEENRALSLREGATLQTFPKSYIFKAKSIAITAKIIGNAVPPEYAKRVGKAIIDQTET